MSVINQVLVELEKRRASGAERVTIPDHVRALPDSGDGHSAWWIVAASVAGIALLATIWAAVGGYSFSFPRHASSAALPGAEATIERVVVASAEAGARPREGTGDAHDGGLRPAARMSLELSSALETDRTPQPNTEAARPSAPIAAGRVLSRASVERDPASAAETATPTAAATPAAATKDAARPAAAPPPAVVDKQVAGAAAKVEIKKEVKQPTSRELADHEYRKAATLLQQGRLSEAQEGFRATLALFSGHHGARQALVALLLNAKMNAEAERTLQEGLKLAPDQIGFAMTLARLQVDRGDNAGAIATLQGGVPHAQGSPDFVAFLAALLQRQGRHEDAIEQFSAALRGKPGAGVWWLGLGISLQVLNRTADAQEAYRRAKSSNLNPELAAFADQRLHQLGRD